MTREDHEKLRKVLNSSFWKGFGKVKFNIVFKAREGHFYRHSTFI
jgi:hypothetical protein